MTRNASGAALALTLLLAPAWAQDEEPAPETKIAFKVNISADAYLQPPTPGNSEGRSNRKFKKVKFKTADFIGGILEAEGINGINPRKCKLLACFNGDLEAGQIDFEDIDFYIYCRDEGLTLALDDDGELEGEAPPSQPELEEADDEFRVVSQSKVKRRGATIQSSFTFWEWDFELEGLSIAAVTRGDAKITLKDGEFQNVTFKADGFHNINVDGEEGLGKIRVQIAGSEKDFVPPVEETPVEEVPQ